MVRPKVATDDADRRSVTTARQRGERTGEPVDVCIDEPSISVLRSLHIVADESSSRSCTAVYKWPFIAFPNVCPNPSKFASAIISRICSSIFHNTLCWI